MDSSPSRPLAVVTGASSGIGYHLARCCATHGFDLVVAADRPLDGVADDFRILGAHVTVVHADLASQPGVDDLCEAIGTRLVDALLANAGHGLGNGFLEQDFDDVRHVIDTNVTGTLYLLHRLAPGMRRRGLGRILITGSIAGFIDSFTAALRNELQDTGVTVTCLMPGPTDTEFFARADMLDTQVGADEHKADPAQVAQVGFDAMMDGEADVVAGLKNKVQVALAKLTPSQVLAEQHRKMAEPGSAED